MRGSGEGELGLYLGPVAGGRRYIGTGSARTGASLGISLALPCLTRAVWVKQSALGALGRPGRVSGSAGFLLLAPRWARLASSPTSSLLISTPYLLPLLPPPPPPLISLPSRLLLAVMSSSESEYTPPIPGDVPSVSRKLFPAPDALLNEKIIHAAEKHGNGVLLARNESRRADLLRAETTRLQSLYAETTAPGEQIRRLLTRAALATLRVPVPD